MVCTCETYLKNFFNLQVIRLDPPDQYFKVDQNIKDDGHCGYLRV